MARLPQGLTSFVREHAVEASPISNPLAMLDPGTADALQAVGVPSDRVEPMLATLFWQIVLSSPAFPGIAADLSLAMRPGDSTELIVVPHGETVLPRFDLLVLDPLRKADSPASVPIAPDSLDVTQAMSAWRARRHYDIDRLAGGGLVGASVIGRLRRLVMAVPADFARTLARGRTFAVVAATMPDVELTGLPPSPWEVLPGAGAKQSTAGAVVVDAAGRVGVTASLHALGSGTPVPPVGTTVTVHGFAGTVQGADLVSDSCFIEINPLPPGTPKTTSGPLMGVTPRQFDTATFDGVRSGVGTKAVIEGWSPDLPIILRNNQLKVFTDRVTSGGDSGAALLESTGNILGFSFWRSKDKTKPAHSAWIWAHSAFDALGLSDL